jgi:hypothetical protein
MMDVAGAHALAGDSSVIGPPVRQQWTDLGLNKRRSRFLNFLRHLQFYIKKNK